MIVLAVLLLLVVAVVVMFVVVTGLTPTVTLDWSQINTEVTLTALALFLLGAVTLLVAETGLALLLRGNRKSWERRRELKRLRRVEGERARHEVSPSADAVTHPAPAAPGRTTTTTDRSAAVDPAPAAGTGAGGERPGSTRV